MDSSSKIVKHDKSVGNFIIYSMLFFTLVTGVILLGLF